MFVRYQHEYGVTSPCPTPMKTSWYSRRKDSSRATRAASAKRCHASPISSPAEPWSTSTRRLSNCASGGPINKLPSRLQVPARNAWIGSAVEGVRITSSFMASISGAEPAWLGPALEILGKHVGNAAIAAHLQTAEGVF